MCTLCKYAALIFSMMNYMVYTVVYCTVECVLYKMYPELSSEHDKGRKAEWSPPLTPQWEEKFGLAAGQLAAASIQYFKHQGS